jgi:hypothetical protein
MEKLFSIVDIELECEGDRIQIPFANCFNDNGLYSFDTRIQDIEFYKKHNRSYLTLRGLTEKQNKIEAYGLIISHFATPSMATTLTCDRSVKIIQAWGGDFEKETTIVNTKKHRVFGIELEGLKIQFSDKTEIERFRRSGKIDDFLNFKFDHSQFELLINDETLRSSYSVLLTANASNENVFVEFVKGNGFSELTEEEFKKFRSEFIYFLSFINGAPILLRRQFTGTFGTIEGSGALDAEVVSIYSRKPQDKLYYNDYLPINQEHWMTERILPVLFIKGFDNYYRHNKTLDLNALVVSLNEAWQTAGPREQYYILITALEKVVNNFHKTQPRANKLIDPASFDGLKTDLLNVLGQHRATIKAINKPAYDIFRSRIGGLNSVKVNDNKQKFYQFFAFCHISVSPYLAHLIEVERNQAVHEGKVGGKDDEALAAYLKLDHLIRDIILNLMGYDRVRKPRIIYQTPFPYPSPWSG